MPDVIKNNTFVLFTISILATAICFIDTFASFGVAGCVPYVLVVLGSLLLSNPSAPVIAAIACTALTYGSMLFAPTGSEWGIMFLNRSLAVCAIWITALLGLRVKQQMRSLERQSEQLRRDLTVREQTEQRLRLQQDLLQKVVAGAHSQSDILNELCLHVERILPSAICSIMLLDERTGKLTVGAVPSGGETACTILDGLVPAELAGACGTAVHTRTTVIIEDTETDPRWEPIREAARPLGIKSCWSIPVFYDNQRILGTFAISHPQVRRPTTADLQLLETSSYLVGITVQRHQADEAQKRSEERYRDLYESAPAAYFTSTMDGHIKSANHSAVQLLGYSQTELKNRMVVDLYAPGKNGQEMAQRIQSETQSGKEVEGEELEMQRADGSHVWVSLTIRLIYDSHGHPFERRAVVKNITQRKHHQELQSLQKTALEHVATGKTLEDILNVLCQQVEQLAPQGICSILTLDPNTQILKFCAGPSVPESLASALDGMIPGPCAGSCGTATFRSEPVYVVNTATDPLWADLQDAAQRYNIGACWSYPIFRDGRQVLGSFAISFPHPHAPTAFDIQLLETASYLAGIAIQQREIEKARLESEERYRSLYEDSPSMYFTLNPDGQILSVNQFGAYQLGYTVQELIGKPVSILFLEEDQLEVAKGLSECLSGPPGLRHWEFQKVRKDGSRIWVQESCRRVKDHDNQDVFLIVCHNVTAQKEVEERNRQHELAVRALYEITSSSDRSFEYQVRALLALGCQRFGLPIGLLTHRVANELELQFVCSSDPAFKEGQRVLLENTFCSTALTADAPISFEHAAVSEWREHRGYTELGLEAYLGTKVMKGSEAYGTFCFTSYEPHATTFSEADRDFLRLIARWVSAELERLETEQLQRRLVTIVESTTDMIGMATPEGETLYLNSAGKSLMAIPTDEDLVGMPIVAFHPPAAQHTLLKDALPQIKATGVWEGDTTLLTRQGQEIPASQVLLAQRDQAGNLECFTTIIRDISERKAAEEQLQQSYEQTKTLSEQLQESESRLRQIIDLVPHFIFAKDQEGRFILANEAVAKVYGTSVQALIGKREADFAKSQEEVAHFRQDDADAIAHGLTKVIQEEHITDASGAVQCLQTTKIPFTFAGSALPAVLGISINITAQKEADAQLREAYHQTRELSARLKAAEESERKRIARELHDEFGQMLAVLKFDISWMERRLAEQAPLNPHPAILDKARSMATSTDDLIRTVRRIATSLRPSILDDLGLIPALEWQTKEFQNRTGISCQFSTDLDSQTCRLENERATALFRIAQELFTNILRHANASQVDLALEKQDAFLTLSVSDNGRGLGETTTRDTPSLGLLGIRERLASFGGEFLIQGQAGRGTRAHVRMPISETQLV